MDRVFDYEDVMLIPNKCIVNSRRNAIHRLFLAAENSACRLCSPICRQLLMKKIALFLAENGYFYIMHRFEPEKRMDFIHEMQEKGLYASISVGIKPREFEFIKELKESNLIPEYITIDVAHGHSDTVIGMISSYKRTNARHFPLIAGNVGTPEAVWELENAGADAAKVGIGPGRV